MVHVWREFQAFPDIPPWMLLQTTCEGSYRAEDMLELLEKTLPPVTEDYESQVICLDLYAARRDPRIAEFIASRGHVLQGLVGGRTE